MSIYARVAGTGSYLPALRLSNQDLVERLAKNGLESSDEWITTRSGISARHLRGIKTAVDRDLGLIQGVVASVKKQKDPAAKSRAAAYANEIESQMALIRAELIRAVIDKID